MFAVFDGHGGNHVSDFLKEYFVSKLTNNQNFIDENYSLALTETFDNIDQMIRTKEGNELLKRYTRKEEDPTTMNGYKEEDEEDIAFWWGSTACVVLIVGDKIYCANSGDSRCVLSKKGKAIPLSFDHKPSNPSEEERINKAGMW